MNASLSLAKTLGAMSFKAGISIPCNCDKLSQLIKEDVGLYGLTKKSLVQAWVSGTIEMKKRSV